MTTPLPKYQCHKIVEAAPIKAIRERANGHERPGFELDLDVDGTIVTVIVLDAFFARGIPSGDLVYVRYADGYESFSPKLTFDEGYTRIVEQG